MQEPPDRLEAIVKMFAGLPAAVGKRWNVAPLVPGRLFLSRDTSGRFSVFIVGEAKSFGALPKIAGISYSDDIEAVPGGYKLTAARLTSNSLGFGSRVMAHVAYELERRIAADQAVTNAVLLREVSWILELLVDRDSILSPDAQKGLLGECVFLRRLLITASRAGLPASAALACWFGYDRAKRDFAGNGIAVEVKTTSQNTRIHHVGSLAQLEPQGGEAVYVFSVGAKLDPSAPRKLPDFVADVQGMLRLASGAPDAESIAKFHEGLRAYGYEPDREHLYRAVPGFLGFHLPPKLFGEASLDRVRLTSFKGDKLPSMVPEVMYDLSLGAGELSPAEEDAAVRQMLGV